MARAFTETVDRIELTLASRTWDGKAFEQTFSIEAGDSLLFKPHIALGEAYMTDREGEPLDEQIVTVESVEDAGTLEAATRDGRLPPGEWDDEVLDHMWEALIVDEVGELLERWSPEGRAARAEYLKRTEG